MKFNFFHTNFFKSRLPPPELPENGNGSPNVSKKQTSPGGWKSMPYILGNETFERLGSSGLLANFMVFLMKEFHMDQVMASNVINIWSGVTNFGPLIGAFISDSYLGRFYTIAFSSLAAFLGMLLMTLIVWIPKLHPPKCDVQLNQCIGPTSSQLGTLVLALVFLSIGAAGIRPCSIPFGVDQFDPSTEQGRRSINSFFNLYYTTFTVVLVIALTLVVYIQDTVSWVLGFAIPAALVLSSIVLFLLGMRLYVYVKPEGSVFSNIAQVVVAAYRKRRVRVLDGDNADGALYFDPPLKGNVVLKLPLSNQFKFLNKAALIVDKEVSPTGYNPNPWKLCSIQVVEEAKCLLKVVPIWASGILCFTAIVQQGTFTISQASKMNRHLSQNFKVPPGSLVVISMITITIWLPFYDRVLVPTLRKVTRLEGGITLLQRMGMGIVFSILSMAVAGLVERMRRALALVQPDGVAPISVFWLAPQLVLMGLAEAFNVVGQIEFYNKELPENMSSVANALVFCTLSGASYVSAIIVNVVHKTTGGNGHHPDWLTKDINDGKVENFYFLICGLSVVNLWYFIWVAWGYKYKVEVGIHEDIQL